ncbi:uncharacterized protein VP01_882g3 [Puccinia sorghi]|uniref:Uncharacterized protein n=1 Tax=Puccinia sorghi TaxID=27349 RepID=A0A0L6U8A8_9BASI|nr:uncharacterized protein VP01_882g3 [Puccinia sorghi]
MVRLITHNLLACNAKTCSAPTNFPLRFEQVQRVEIKEAELNKEFIKGFLNKLDFDALLYASRALGDAALPDSFPLESFQNPDGISDEVFAALHHALLEVDPCPGGKHGLSFVRPHLCHQGRHPKYGLLTDLAFFLTSFLAASRARNQVVKSTPDSFDTVPFSTRPFGNSFFYPYFYTPYQIPFLSMNF